MRYWICRTPGKVEGPFDRPVLESMMASGEVTGELQICPEGSETWQTLHSILSEPGNEDDQKRTPPTASSEARTRHLESYENSPINGLSYSFSNAFSVGWNGFKEHYGLLLGISFIFFIASLVPTVITLPLNLGNPGAANSIGFIAMIQVTNYAWSLLVTIPVSIGSIWVGIKIARGEEVRFADIWTPYHRLGWVILGILLLYLLALIIYIVGLLCGGIPGAIIGFIVGSISGDPPAGVLTGALITGVIFIPVIFYGLSRFILMMIPIIDPKLGRMNPPDAMLWSLKNTKNGIAWSLVGLFVVMSLIMGFSFAACVLPYLFFALPLSQTTFGAAYALIASRSIDGMLCEHCGYAREGNDSAQCPECGKAWKLDQELA